MSEDGFHCSGVRALEGLPRAAGESPSLQVCKRCLRVALGALGITVSVLGDIKRLFPP